MDENFFRTVVLVVEHTDDGAVGVVLNRPSQTLISEGPLGELDPIAADPPLVFVGGPVAPDSAICLARRRGPLEAPDEAPDEAPEEAADPWQPVVQGLGVLDLSAGDLRLVAGLDRVRVFAGYAGWGSGQLEAEIAEGAWYVLDADPDDALSGQPGGLWRSVLSRQGGKLAMVANFPADPNMN